jgi:hypothetical protein
MPTLPNWIVLPTMLLASWKPAAKEISFIGLTWVYTFVSSLDWKKEKEAKHWHWQ